MGDCDRPEVVVDFHLELRRGQTENNHPYRSVKRTEEGNLRFAFSQLRFLHPLAEVPEDEIQGWHHEVVGTGHYRGSQGNERIGESRELATEYAIE